MSGSPHSELIGALIELYTVLHTLAAIPPNLVRLPSHPPGALKKDAALATGYDPEAVELMNSIPYLDVDANENSPEFQFIPCTDPANLIHPGVGPGYFKCHRRMYQDEAMPPTAVRLTMSDLYGTELIYDVSTSEFLQCPSSTISPH
ncbi:hypothetical protein EJ03DRAFT_330044 [Teratosphaeria nubilosa]|uniref:Uncharacterized protein n=1 Tax=Teratosphaeria nubilosa TaxID=161662 RepID=A0A6G1L0Y3_9PEZI|nr:hypothetical protein EJ03DRAFT_330044 [Teratosphaeria nubilosa]